MSYQYRNLPIRPETEPRYEQARELVAEELGEEPTHDQVVRELCEAYTGGDALGNWRGDRDV